MLFVVSDDEGQGECCYLCLIIRSRVDVVSFVR